MDERFKKINRLLGYYSLGQFDKRLPLSKRLDEVDAFINGVNMLGEELKAITISRNYFTNIFNSVSDMVFILDKKGMITNVNKAASEQLERSVDSLLGISIDTLKTPDRRPLFSEVLKQLKNEKSFASLESTLESACGKSIPVELTAAWLLSEAKRKKGILLRAKDITLQRKTENLILRAIIDTQENERHRLAKDLHDSLGQQLSAIKFYISTLAGTMTDKEGKAILLKSNDALTEVMTDMRNICFNLMPKTLEEFGLLQAVKEIAHKTRYNNQIQFTIQEPNEFPLFSRTVEIDIYRVIQEFIGNAIKHGKATRIQIKFTNYKKSFRITLIDNGKGFDPAHIESKGMGLQNVRSRVKSHQGELTIHSEIGKGTKYILEIPINI